MGVNIKLAKAAEKGRVKERPIIFNAEMVRAILDGRKTQTRRPVKPQPETRPSASDPNFIGTWLGSWNLDKVASKPILYQHRCPHGQPGDRLWVRETWCPEVDAITSKENGKALYRADGQEVHLDDGDGWTVWNKDGTMRSPWRPSIHMPRWASRITLEVTGVRVERVQEISQSDAFAEGFRFTANRGDPDCCEAHDWFKATWDSIYAAKDLGWDANPWVWVVEFKRVM